MKTFLAAMALVVLPSVAMAQSTDSTRQRQGQGASQDTTMSSQQGGDVVSDSTQSKHKAEGYNQGNPSDTSKNQDQSGVTNSKTGKSTLGKKVSKTSPTQGAAVTSKGDTLKQGGDSLKAKRDTTGSSSSSPSSSSSSTPPRH